MTERVFQSQNQIAFTVSKIHNRLNPFELGLLLSSENLHVKTIREVSLSQSQLVIS